MLGRSSFLAGAVALIAASFSAAQSAVVAVPRRRSLSPRELYSGSGTPYSRVRRRGPGWTNRHAQRVAAKKRAVATHRARSKGRA